MNDVERHVRGWIPWDELLLGIEVAAEQGRYRCFSPEYRIWQWNIVQFLVPASEPEELSRVLGPSELERHPGWKRGKAASPKWPASPIRSHLNTALKHKEEVLKAIQDRPYGSPSPLDAELIGGEAGAQLRSGEDLRLSSFEVRLENRASRVLGQNHVLPWPKDRPTPGNETHRASGILS